jgi:hypothetical protein
MWYQCSPVALSTVRDAPCHCHPARMISFARRFGLRSWAAARKRSYYQFPSGMIEWLHRTLASARSRLLYHGLVRAAWHRKAGHFYGVIRKRSDAVIFINGNR